MDIARNMLVKWDASGLIRGVLGLDGVSDDEKSMLNPIPINIDEWMIKPKLVGKEKREFTNSSQ